MRERRPADWGIDLGRRHPLEDEFAAALAAHPALLLVRRSTAALDALDYQVLGPGERLAQVELKAKHQPYRGWSHLRPGLAERDLFILDELALRRLVEAGRYGYLVVVDAPSARWCVWSTAELVLASKVRTVRVLASGRTRLKAKVLLDLGESGTTAGSSAEAADALARSLAQCDRHWEAIGPWPHGPTVHDPHGRSA